MLFTNKITHGAAIIAITHNTGRAGVYAKFMLNWYRVDIIPVTDRTIGINNKFWYQK